MIQAAVIMKDVLAGEEDVIDPRTLVPTILPPMIAAAVPTAVLRPGQ